MKTIKINYAAVFAVGFLLIALAIVIGWSNIQPALGSVTYGNDYLATSTAPSNVYGAQTALNMKLNAGNGPSQGSLGSVTILGANTGILNIWDATTTNINLRTNQTATSSLKLLASIPASASAQTYVFDAQYSVGLVYDVPLGIIPTTTITYR